FVSGARAKPAEEEPAAEDGDEDEGGFGGLARDDSGDDDEDDDDEDAINNSILLGKYHAGINARAMPVDLGGPVDDSDEDDDDDDDSARQRRQPRNRDEEDDEDAAAGQRPSMGMGSHRGFGSMQPEPEPEPEAEPVKPVRVLGGGHATADQRAHLRQATTKKPAAQQRRGIGASSGEPAAKDDDDKIPTKFGSSKSVRFNSTLDDGGNSPATKPSTPTTAPAPSHSRFPAGSKPAKPDKDFAKFVSASKGASIGLNYLKKMGYVPGQGLGKDGSGISRPVDVKLRPKGKGLGHGGFDERTDAVKEEQRRMGKTWTLDGDESEEDKEEDPERKAARERAGAWRKGPGKGKKTKAKFKSAEEIIQSQRLQENHLLGAASLSGDPGAAAAAARSTATKATKIVDMTGPEVLELTDMAQASHRMALRDTTSHLVELRHNVRMCAGEAELELVRLAKGIEIEKGRQARLAEDVGICGRRVDDLEARLARLRLVRDIAVEIEVGRKKLEGGDVGPRELMAVFGEPFGRLELEFMQEFVEQGLDDMVVGAITPFIRQMMIGYQPLENPGREIVDVLRRWGVLLKTATVRPKVVSRMMMEEDTFADKGNVMRPMTPNLWSPRNPEPLLLLLETWYPQQPTANIVLHEGIYEHATPKSPHVLPPWMELNILTQLVLPKLRDAVDEWDPLRDRDPIHRWLFPWLPWLGDRFGELYDPVIRRFSVLFAGWAPGDDEDEVDEAGATVDRSFALIEPWFEVLPRRLMTQLLHRAVLPKLVATLRHEFQVNPARQVNAPLDRVLVWRRCLDQGVFQNLIETEFFPKWISVLHAWLSHEDVDFDEVTRWYEAWKSYFPQDVLAMQGVGMQFRAGLELMNKALSLREGEPLGPVPKIVPWASVEAVRKLDGPRAGKKEDGKGLPQLQRGRFESQRFKELVEKVAAGRDLTLLPSTRMRQQGGKAVFRLGGAVDGRDVGGVLIYVDEAVVYVLTGEAEDGKGGDWKPIGLDEVMDLATTKKWRGKKK
ncbi:hypothetical protein HK101_006844, partial [Irineochytrium annulatum]